MRKHNSLVTMRKDRLYTQAYLARQLGVTQSTVAMWETGKVVPSMKNILALADLYGVTVDDICSCIKR